ncbi:MAG: glycoside hydrolase family 16 protein [Actinomycetales bacterium]|nr:glycoside hydrolase family 16 protein [Actinomycetales bacterium]
MPPERRTHPGIVGGVAAALTLGVLAIGATALVGGETGGPATPGAILWSDEFDGPAGAQLDSSRWRYQTGGGGWGNHEWQTYRAENGVLDGEGHLVLSARIDESAPPEERYTSARMVSVGTVSEGLVEARIRLPDGAGLLPAFWMLGADIDEVGYPASGEIDVVEIPGASTHSAHTLHAPDPRDGGPGSHGQVTVDVDHAVPLSDDFHVFGVRKEADRVTFLIDGQEVGTVERDQVADRLAWPFDKPFTLLFSLAIGGDWPGPPDASTPAESQMVVDWVRVRALD